MHCYITTQILETQYKVGPENTKFLEVLQQNPKNVAAISFIFSGVTELRMLVIISLNTSNAVLSQHDSDSASLCGNEPAKTQTKMRMVDLHKSLPKLVSLLFLLYLDW